MEHTLFALALFFGGLTNRVVFLWRGVVKRETRSMAAGFDECSLDGNAVYHGRCARSSSYTWLGCAARARLLIMQRKLNVSFQNEWLLNSVPLYGIYVCVYIYKGNALLCSFKWGGGSRGGYF